MPKFGAAERKVAQLLKPGMDFVYQGSKYSIIRSGKPTCAHGEPKTDIYVLAKGDEGSPLELKISYKKGNADFLENKISGERAQLLFGSNWQEIVQKSTLSVWNQFRQRHLIYKKSYGRTEKGSFTLGWKYEIQNKSSGKLSGLLPLTREQVMDVYAGTHLPPEKKDAYVDDQCIPNSGVVTHMLIGDNFCTTQQVIDSMCSIAEYVNQNPNVYFVCKALNYRSFVNKYDGNRPLGVSVEWYVENGQLCHRLVFDRPLLVGGNEAAANLCNSLKMLGVRTTDDLRPEMVNDHSILHG